MMGMMGNDRKKLATLIVGSLPRENEKEVDMNGEDNSYNEMDAVAEEMIAAIDRKDPASLAACLKGLMYKFSAGLQKGPVEEMESEEY